MKFRKCENLPRTDLYRLPEINIIFDYTNYSYLIVALKTNGTISNKECLKYTKQIFPKFFENYNAVPLEMLWNNSPSIMASPSYLES